MPETKTRHNFYYASDRPLRMWEVAETLVATEAILRRTPAVLEQLFPGTKVHEIEVLLEGLRDGSFYEDFVVKLIFGNQEELDGFVTRTRARVGLDHSSDNQKIVGAVFLGLVLYGGHHAVGRLFGPEEATKQIEINNSTIIVVGAEAAGVEPEQLQRAIESAASDKTQRSKLANEAIRVLRPAKGTEPGALIVNSDPALTVQAQTIALMPSHVFPEKPEEYSQDFKNVELEIRATDLDSKKRGWGARIPAATGGNRRIPLEVATHINTAVLAAGKTINGDVTVSFEMREGGAYATRAYLSEIIPMFDNISPLPSHSIWGEIGLLPEGKSSQPEE